MRYISLIVVVGLVTLFSSCLNSTIDTSVTDQFTRDTTSIKAYLAENGIYATQLPSGIWYIIDSASEGIRATYEDTISVTYTMKVMANNSILDQQTSPIDFNLSGLITGVQMAMPYFQKGSKGRIFIPSYYGYGANPASSSVPANANLIFDFNLKNVQDYHLKADTTTIGTYLASESITNAVRDPSGLRYTVDTTGSIGGITNKTIIGLKYGLKFLSGGQITSFTNTTVQYPFYNLPLAWQIVLPQVKSPVGSYITLYVPSSLGYGPSYYSGSGISIPGNSILIYNIKLVSVN